MTDEPRPGREPDPVTSTANDFAPRRADRVAGWVETFERSCAPGASTFPVVGMDAYRFTSPPPGPTFQVVRRQLTGADTFVARPAGRDPRAPRLTSAPVGADLSDVHHAAPVRDSHYETATPRLAPVMQPVGQDVLAEPSGSLGEEFSRYFERKYAPRRAGARAKIKDALNG